MNLAERVDRPPIAAQTAAGAPRPGMALARNVGGRTVALFNVDGRLLAVDDACLRCCASLTAGTLDGMRVRCGCGWVYDLTTGDVAGVPRLHLERYDVDVDADGVRVVVPAAPR